VFWVFGCFGGLYRGPQSCCLRLTELLPPSGGL
jgi:hypothetical protein